MLEIMSSTGAEAPESSPRQLLQVLLADRTPHGLYELLCYLLGIFLVNSAFAFPRNGTVLSLPHFFWGHITPNYPRFV